MTSWIKHLLLDRLPSKRIPPTSDENLQPLYEKPSCEDVPQFRTISLDLLVVVVDDRSRATQKEEHYLSNRDPLFVDLILCRLEMKSPCSCQPGLKAKYILKTAENMSLAPREK